jgi:quercetin dioxygenase-like cupin family protein
MLALLGCASIAGATLWNQPAAGFDFVPLGEGVLPSGELISTFQITFAPGDAVPFHFHAGQTWAIVVSGTLTEERGCGTAPLIHTAGSTLTVSPGIVHRELNLGTIPTLLTVVSIVPGCYSNYNSAIYVNGPHCEGDSGHSRIEKVPPCGPEDKDDAIQPKTDGAGAHERREQATESARKATLTLSPWASPVHSLVFNPEGGFLACGDLDGNVRFWPAGSLAESHRVDLSRSPARK